MAAQWIPHFHFEVLQLRQEEFVASVVDIRLRALLRFMRAMMLKSSNERFLQGVKAYETFRDQGGPGGREFTYLFERMLNYLVTRLEIVDMREVEN
ncbi:hypothetical protein RZS08_66975, partial [Arthrospira platensis SPKY1]|nr:hypothetical protein [Arthrospira platensis SPKY1]